ncbi:MAG: hypothetical protein IPK10_01390 [Bacteroidetes bacterium]|nr:hypothetical protein [Bacteroidota bacterium]
MQALYAFYQSEPKDIRRTEQELLNGTDKIYELYLTQLQFLLELGASRINVLSGFTCIHGDW